MRLSDYEIKAIKQTFDEIFSDGKIYLFGSRVDDSKKGGDIDLSIQTTNTQDILVKKIDFLAKIKDKIGDQKIDVVVSKDKTRAIEKEAISKGIEL